MKKRICRGSFTVEAACLMSLILLVVMGCIYLFFHVHNYVWLTAAAYEAAVTGSLEGVREDGDAAEAAEAKSRELGSSGFFAAENLRSQVSAGDTVRVVYTLDTVSDFGGWNWKIRAVGESAAVRPTRFIWKLKAAAEIMKGEK